MTKAFESGSNRQSAADSVPQIIENYQDFQPPSQLRALVEGLLNAVPPRYLVDLKTVLLTNQGALTRDQRREKLSDARGAYYRETNLSPAHVVLLIDNPLSSWPCWALRVPFLRYRVLSEVLYHEIGHHIHAVHRPGHDGRENVAEDWQRKLNGIFIRKRFWYLRPILFPTGKLARFILKSATSKKLEEQYARRRG
jgi:hypothetical protein